MKLGIVFGCLIAAVSLSGCGSSASFDWKAYSQNMPLNHKASGEKNPALYGFSGWGGGNRIVEIIGPLASRVKVSESQSINFTEWPGVMGNIKERYLAGYPIILLGHSAGCSDAISVSNVLEKANIPVGLILIDAIYLRSGFFKPDVKGLPNSHLIPGNVYMVENYVTDSSWGGRYLTDRDLKNSANTKFHNIFIKTAHLNLLREEYSVQYAASMGRILDKYSQKY